MTSDNQDLISIYKEDKSKLNKLKLTKHDTYAEVVQRLLKRGKN